MEEGNPQYNLELVMAFRKAKGSPAPGRLDGEPSTFSKRTVPAPKQHFKKFLLAKVISKYDWLSSGGPFEITN